MECNKNMLNALEKLSFININFELMFKVNSEFIFKNDCVILKEFESNISSPSLHNNKTMCEVWINELNVNAFITNNILAETYMFARYVLNKWNIVGDSRVLSSYISYDNKNDNAEIRFFIKRKNERFVYDNLEKYTGACIIMNSDELVNNNFEIKIKYNFDSFIYEVINEKKMISNILLKIYNSTINELILEFDNHFLFSITSDADGEICINDLDESSAEFVQAADILPNLCNIYGSTPENLWIMTDYKGYTNSVQILMNNTKTHKNNIFQISHTVDGFKAYLIPVN